MGCSGGRFHSHIGAEAEKRMDRLPADIDRGHTGGSQHSDFGLSVGPKIFQERRLARPRPTGNETVAPRLFHSRQRFFELVVEFDGLSHFSTLLFLAVCVIFDSLSNIVNIVASQRRIPVTSVPTLTGE